LNFLTNDTELGLTSLDGDYYIRKHSIHAKNRILKKIEGALFMQSLNAPLKQARVLKFGE